MTVEIQCPDCGRTWHRRTLKGGQRYCLNCQPKHQGRGSNRHAAVAQGLDRLDFVEEAIENIQDDLRKMSQETQTNVLSENNDEIIVEITEDIFKLTEDVSQLKGWIMDINNKLVKLHE
jgi:acetyl-CoA carboxylase beta subunit